MVMTIMYPLNFFRRSLHVGLISLCSCVAFSSISMPQAFAAKNTNETQQVSAKVGKPLQQARKLMDEKKWKEAIAKTKEVQAIANKTPLEEALINEMLAYCMINLKDYAGAVAIYETMLAGNQFKAEDIPKRILTMSQIYFSLKNYPKSITYGERYLKEVGADLDVMRQVSQAYYLQNNFVRAEDYAKNLIASAKKQGKPVQENWLQLLLSSQHKQNKKSEMVSTLELMLASYPSDAHWSDMFMHVLSDTTFSDRQSIIFLKLVQKTNLMEPNEYIELAELSLAVANPGDAKLILEEGFNKGVIGKGESKDRELKLLGLARAQAAEDIKTLPTIEKEAATKPTGEALLKIGEAYLGHSQYENAIAAFNKGIAKGGIKMQDEAYINIGIAYLGLKKPEEAIKAFKSVPDTSKLARLSRLWVIHAGTIK